MPSRSVSLRGLKLDANSYDWWGSFRCKSTAVIHQGYLYGKPELSKEWIARWHENATK